jgi:4-hydroxy-tetrahydrodipicolinate synthase
MGLMGASAPDVRRAGRPLRLNGVFGVLPTAFHEDGSLDLAGTSALAEAHVAAGVAGLTALGVMGEAAELTDAERREVISCAVVAGLPVVVGVSSATAAIVVARSEEAVDLGATGLMVGPAPDLTMAAAVRAAARAGLPIVIQDYPAGSGVSVSVADLSAVIAKEPLVAGIKVESPPTSGTIAALLTAHPGIGVVGGLGGLFLIDELRAGATGVMTGFALPERLVSIVTTFRHDEIGAEREWIELLPLMRLEAFPPYSLAVRKEVWRLCGVIGSSRCRREGAALDDHARLDVRLAVERVTTGPPATARS